MWTVARTYLSIGASMSIFLIQPSAAEKLDSYSAIGTTEITLTI